MEAERQGHSGCGFIQRSVAHEEQDPPTQKLTLVWVHQNSANSSSRSRQFAGRASGRGERDIRRASDNNQRCTGGRHQRESVLRNVMQDRQHYEKDAAQLGHSAHNGASGQQQTADGGTKLSCDLCQRPFQSAYLLHMLRTYFHIQPPPPGPDDSAPAAENDRADADNPSDNGDEEKETTRHSTNNSTMAVKS